MKQSQVHDDQDSHQNIIPQGLSTEFITQSLRLPDLILETQFTEMKPMNPCRLHYDKNIEVCGYLYANQYKDISD